MTAREESARCPRCNWPLVADMRDGCVPGNCSYRPEEGSEEWYRIKEREAATAAKERSK